MRGRGWGCRWLVASTAALLAVLGLITACLWPTLFEAVFASQVALKPGARSYNEWAAPSLPLYFDVYLFNWTNAQEFPHVVPHLEQLGPYRYREIRRHVNISFHPHNDTIQYQTFRSWHFEPELSNGSLSDVITTLNMIAAGAVFKSRYENYFQQKIVSGLLSSTSHKLSVTKTAGELMFEGYEDTLLTLSSFIPQDGMPVYDRFGLFYGRNNSDNTDGHVEISAGNLPNTMPGVIKSWNYADHLPFYKGECSKMYGSAGEFLPRNLTEDMKLTMFISDLCRMVHMDYRESGDYQGLQYHTYELTENSFDTANPCFCNGPCIWSGVMNVSACRYDSPAVLSLPHFLYGDPRLREMVTGLHPDPDKHSFYFSVEPKMGVPIDVAGRFQLNFYIEPNPYFAMYMKVPQMLFPIFWVEQHVLIDDKIVNELKYARGIMDYGATVCVGFALFFASLAAIATCTNIYCWKEKKHRYMPPVDMMYEKPKDEAELKLNLMR